MAAINPRTGLPSQITLEGRSSLIISTLFPEVTKIRDIWAKLSSRTYAVSIYVRSHTEVGKATIYNQSKLARETKVTYTIV